MSGNSGSSAPFGGDYRRPESFHTSAQPTATATSSSSSNAASSRQSHERSHAAPAPAEKAESNGSPTQAPFARLRGPGGATTTAATATTTGSPNAPIAAAASANNGVLAASSSSPSNAAVTTAQDPPAPSGASCSPPRGHVDPTASIPANVPVPYGGSGSAGPTVAATEHRSTAMDAPASSNSSTHLHSSTSLPPAPTARTTATTATAAPTTTAAVAAPPAPGAGEEDAFKRPIKALSVNLVSLLKVINAQYCTRQRMEAPGTKYNNGFDDREGHYLVMLGEEILARYTVQEVLGKGSFGTVVRCYDEKRRETVALKITRRGSNFRTQAKLELDLLLKLNNNPALNHLVVKLLKVFDWQGHLVLAFELLSFNLYQLIKCTRYTGVSLDLVRKFAYQLMHTLRHLEEQTPAPIIHCDIKPENILLRNQSRSGIRLIDFGSACYANKRVHRYIQSRFYRSPEVILYLDYTTAIDRWSVGCVLVELFTGTPLFDGRTEAAQLARFEATLGPLPDDMLSQSRKTSKFYTGNATAGYSLIEHPVARRSLESVLSHKQISGDQAQALQTRTEFLDFITQLLRYRPEERLTCSDALQHPFLMPLLSTDPAPHAQTEAKEAANPPRTA